MHDNRLTNKLHIYLSTELMPPLKPTPTTTTTTKETPTPTKATTTLTIVVMPTKSIEPSPTLSSSAAIIHKNILMLTVIVATLIIFRL